MVRKCAILGCPNNKLEAKQKKEGTEKPTVHSFPKCEEVEKRKSWEEFTYDASCKRKLFISFEHAGICTLHFTQDDYLTEHEGPRKRLKSWAVPTVLHQCRKLEQTENNVSILNNSSDTDATADENTDYKIDNARLRKALRESQEESAQKTKTIASLRAKIQKLEQTMNSKDEELKRLDTTLGAVQKLFTPGQQRLLCTDTSRVVWSEEDMAKAISLYTLSPKAYKFLRRVWKYPLPCVTSLKSWLQKLHIVPDVIFQPILNVLNAEFIDAPPFRAQCIIALDEMSIDPIYCYDKILDQVFGGEKNATLICVRGLLTKWKQPLFYTFQSENMAEILLSIIRQLYEVGLFVVGITSDLGPKNRRLCKDLNIAQGKNGIIGTTHFSHPVTGKPVFYFPDFPHLLKCLRNHLMDTKLTLADGTVLDRNLIVNLVQAQKDEFKLTHKLTHRHIYARGQQRQKVRTAFQVFSHTVATAIRKIFPEKQAEADFIDLMNNFSDLANVRHPERSSNPFQNAYGMNLPEQNNLLQKVYETFMGMKVGGRKGCAQAPFQRGFLIYIISLQGLLKEMVKETGCEYLLPTNVNQDFLESGFGQLRGFGLFTMNPTAVDLRYRVKKLILQWNGSHQSQHSWDEGPDRVFTSKIATLFSTDGTNKDNSGNNSFSGEIEQNIISIDINVEATTFAFKDLTRSEICSEGGKEYASGYIAKKLFERHPELSKTGADEESRNFWVEALSNGGLEEPSDHFFGLFRKFDEYFLAVHGEKVNTERNITQRLANAISKDYPEVPTDIVNFFAQTRLSIRIKSLNKKVEDEKFIYQEQKRNGFKQSVEDVEVTEELSTEELSKEAECILLDLDIFDNL